MRDWEWGIVEENGDILEDKVRNERESVCGAWEIEIEIEKNTQKEILWNINYQMAKSFNEQLRDLLNLTFINDRSSIDY